MVKSVQEGKEKDKVAVNHIYNILTTRKSRSLKNSTEHFSYKDFIIFQGE